MQTYEANKANAYTKKLKVYSMFKTSVGLGFLSRYRCIYIIIIYTYIYKYMYIL